MADVVGSVEVRITVDEDPAERAFREMRAAAREASRQTVRSLDQISDAIGNISVDTEQTAESLSRGLNNAVEVAQARIRAVDVQATVDAGAQAQVSRQLRAVVQQSQAAIRAVRVNADLDDNARTQLTADLQATVRAAQGQLRDIQLGVDEAALAEDVRQAVRVAEATAPPVEIETRVDTDRLSRVGAALRAIGEAARSTEGPAARSGSLLQSIGFSERALSRVKLVVAGIGAAFATLTPSVAGLAAALAQIAPAAAVGATAVLALGSAVGAIGIGTRGVGDAIKAVFAPATAAAGSAAGASNAYANAQRAVKDAVEQAALANERAARQIKDAERALSDAQKEALRAQEDLNDARKQAARDLEDLNSQLAGAQLDQRGAILDLKEAEAELAAVRAKGRKASAQELAEAELARDRAIQRLKDQGVETKRLTSDTAEANRVGAAGSDTVREAQDRVAASQRAVGDQTQALRDAQAEAARTARQGLESIRQAQESLTQSVGGSTGGVNKLAEAMARLSPNARAFVQEIIALKGAFSAVRVDVQEALFEDLARELRITAASVLPVLRKGLVDSAAALNDMTQGVAASARELADNGTLGKALKSANQGLRNLSETPGILTTAFVRLAAAAGPAFEKLTAAAAESAEDIGNRLGAAFESGRLETAIEQAIDLIGQLFSVLGNVGEILGSIFDAANTSGAGFLSTLETITQSIANAFASPQAQAGLTALFSLGAVVAHTLGTVLVAALKAVGPVVAALGPSLEILVSAFGTALVTAFTALGPVLVSAADALGTLIVAISPLIPVLGDLISFVLPVLIPLLDGVGAAFEKASPFIQSAADALSQNLAPAMRRVHEFLDPLLENLRPLAGEVLPRVTEFANGAAASLGPLAASFGDLLSSIAPVAVELATFAGGVLLGLAAEVLPVVISLMDGLAEIFRQTAPVLQTLAGILTRAFLPVISQLDQILPPIIRAFTTLTGAVLPLVDRLLKTIGPSVENLVQTLGDLLVVAAPAVEELAGAIAETGVALGPVIDLAGRLVSIFTDELAATIQTVVIPAIQLVSDILKGNFSAALGDARRLVSGIVDTIKRRFIDLPQQIFQALSSFGTVLRRAVRDAGAAMLNAVGERLAQVRDAFGRLAGRIAAALSSLAGTLRSIASGALNAMLRSVSDGLRRIVSEIKALPGRARDALGDLSTFLYKAGRSLINGFIDGIKDVDVTGAVSGILSDARDLFPFSPAKKGPFSGQGWTFHSGEALAEDFAAGITESQGSAVRATNRLVVQSSAALVGSPLRAAGAVSGPVGSVSPTEVHVTLVNQGVLGSRNEVLDWLSTSLETLRLQGRLAVN